MSCAPRLRPRSAIASITAIAQSCAILAIPAVVAITAITPRALTAQAPKSPLTQDTYDLWRSILQPTLSPDGRWAVYTLTPTVGDGELVARATNGATNGATEHRVARGWTGRPLMSVTGTPFTAQAAHVTADSRHVVLLRYPAKAAMDSARARRGRPADQPKTALAILSLDDGKVTEIPTVRGFQLARDGGRFVAYQIDADTIAAADPPTRADSARPAARRKDSGTPLVLRELATGTEVRVERVTNYAIDQHERWLVYSTTGADSLHADGVFVRNLGTGAVTPLLVATGNYRSLAIDEAGAQVAFVTDADEWTSVKPRMTLYHASLTGTRQRPGVQPATVAVAAASVGEGMRIADRGAIDFVRTGAVLRFGVTHVQPDSLPADSLADKAVVDLWHWRDTRPQPMQRIQVAQDRNRSFSAVFHVATRQMRRLANDSIPTVLLSEDGKVAVATTGVPYAIDAIAGDDGNDILVFNTTTGESRRVAAKVPGNAQLSAAGRFVVWWEKGAWRAHDIAANRTRDLTGAIANVRFDQETHDTPGEQHRPKV